MFILVILSLAMSYVVNNYGLRQLGLELVTFIGVLSAIKYGPVTGLIVTFVLISYHMLAGGFIANYIFWVIPIYSLVVMLSGFFPTLGIRTLGTYATITINAISTIFTVITSPTYLPKYLPFAITNILFNIILFSILGTPLLLLLI